MSSSSHHVIRRVWLPLSQAAHELGMDAATLRKKFERSVRKATDGVAESTIDGVRARKFGGRWKVALNENWSIGPNGTKRDSRARF